MNIAKKIQALATVGPDADVYLGLEMVGGSHLWIGSWTGNNVIDAQGNSAEEAINALEEKVKTHLRK